MCESKVCRVCQIEKPLTEFNRNGAALRNECKACRAEYKKANPEKHREEQRRYLARKKTGLVPTDREKERTLKRESNLRWRRAHPERSGVDRAMRRAAKLQRTPPWLTKEHKRDIVAIYRAARVLSAKTGEDYHVDHIVPLRGRTVSGLHVPWNLQVLRATDNMRKSNTL
jgi:hypothetical protein